MLIFFGDLIALTLGPLGFYDTFQNVNDVLVIFLMLFVLLFLNAKTSVVHFCLMLLLFGVLSVSHFIRNEILALTFFTFPIIKFYLLHNFVQNGLISWKMVLRYVRVALLFGTCISILQLFSYENYDRLFNHNKFSDIKVYTFLSTENYDGTVSGFYRQTISLAFVSLIALHAAILDRSVRWQIFAIVTLFMSGSLAGLVIALTLYWPTKPKYQMILVVCLSAGAILLIKQISYFQDDVDLLLFGLEATRLGILKMIPDFIASARVFDVLFGMSSSDIQLMKLKLIMELPLIIIWDDFNFTALDDVFWTATILQAGIVGSILSLAFYFFGLKIMLGSTTSFSRICFILIVALTTGSHLRDTFFIIFVLFLCAGRKMEKKYENYGY